MRPMSLPAYLKIIRASALYDLVLTAPFATPWTFRVMHELISDLNQLLGGAALPAFGPFHTMIACMMGTVVVFWSVLRLVQPTARLGRFDGIGRFLFSAWMSLTLVATGAPILWLFLIPEVTWGVVQWWPLANDARSDRHGGAEMHAQPLA